MKPKTTYETGATSHAVNDLILFTDNTRELAELRDSIYTACVDMKLTCDLDRFLKLLKAANSAYLKEFPNKEDHSHIYGLSQNQIIEYCGLYVSDFEKWKQENGYKQKQD